MSVVETNWTVFTGAQSSGKSTLALYMAEHYGFLYIPEAARVIIDHDRELGIGDQTRKDEALFQERVLHKKLQTEIELDPSGRYLLDRGLHDTVGYDLTIGLPISLTEQQLRARRYRQVFICASIGEIVQDGARTEDMAFAIALHDNLFKAYRDFGYSPILIPNMSVEDRAAFVLDHL